MEVTGHNYLATLRNNPVTHLVTLLRCKQQLEGSHPGPQLNIWSKCPIF